jgi:hypothetical protein
LFRIVAGQDGERAASSDDPLVRIADQIFARVEPVEDDVEPFLLVPALLFGVPDEERLMLGKPARFEFERRFLVSGGEIRRARRSAKKPNSPDSVLRRMTLSL